LERYSTMPPKRQTTTNDLFDEFLREAPNDDYLNVDLDAFLAEPAARRVRARQTPEQLARRRERNRVNRIAQGLPVRPVREPPPPNQPRVRRTRDQINEARRARYRAANPITERVQRAGTGGRRIWQFDTDFIVDDWERADGGDALRRYELWQSIFRNTGAVRAQLFRPRAPELDVDGLPTGRMITRQLQRPATAAFGTTPIPNTVRQQHDLVVRQLNLGRGRLPRAGQPDNRTLIDYIRHKTYISEGLETKQEAVRKFLERVISVSGITYVFNYTAITLTEMQATEARGLLGNVARDGTAPRLWIDQVEEVYAVPNQKQTCVQDIARLSFGKRFAKQSDAEILESLKSAFHKHGRKLASMQRIWGKYETDTNFRYQMSLIVDDPLPSHQTCAFELVCLAYEMRRNITIVDVDNVLFAQTGSTDEFDRNNKDPIMVLVANGHMYNIQCPRERMRIGRDRNAITTKQFSVKEPEQPITLVIHDPEELAQRVMSEETTIIHTGCSLERLVVDMFHNDRTTISDRFVKSSRGIITSLRVRNHQVILDERASDAQYLAERFSVGLRNKTMAALGREYFESLVPMSMFRSFFHDDVYDYVRSAINHAIQYQSADTGRNCVCIDQRRCYTKSLMDISKWLVCDGNSQVRTCVITCFEDIQDNGLYYVKPTNPSILIDIEGVYIADVVRHALNESLISFGEIAFVLACKSVEYDFAPIVKQVYDTVDDDALSKHVMNHVIGTFVDMQKKACKIRFSFGSETDACTKAIQSLTNNGALLRPVRLGDDVWKIISHTKTRNKRSTILMNIQIVQNARLNVYKTANRVSLDSGGAVVQIKTDSFTISNGNRDVLTRFVESNQSVIGGYKIDKYVAGNMSRKVQKAPYVRKVPAQTIYDFGGDELPDIKALADLVEQGKRVSLEGFAGTGKTTLLRLLVEELKRRGHETQIAAFQNNVAEKMDGKSIHKTYSININGERSKNNRVSRMATIIDEQSMIPTPLWEIIEESNHDILVSCGDFDQLPPVNDQTNRPDSDIYRLVFPTIVRLTQVHRTCDPELMRIIDECRHGNTSNVRTSTTAPITKVNICDTNHKRRQVNEQVMKSLNLPTTHHFTNVKPSKYKQNYSLSIGMPLIRLNNEECNEKIGSLPEAVKSMANASKWCVKDVQNNTITLARMIDFEETASIVSFEFSPKWFAHVFTPCYCITLYKSQGDTIRQPYTIWEWARMKQDRRYAYVAISRATRLNDITVVM